MAEKKLKNTAKSSGFINDEGIFVDVSALIQASAAIKQIDRRKYI